MLGHRDYEPREATLDTPSAWEPANTPSKMSGPTSDRGSKTTHSAAIVAQGQPLVGVQFIARPECFSFQIIKQQAGAIGR
jgi:hypothetical protein